MNAISNVRIGRRVAAVLVTALLLLPGCVTTFPENPEEHRLAQVLREAPDEYYPLLANGVFSRVVGIQPETEAAHLTDLVKAEWAGIGKIDTIGALLDFLQANDLSALAERIQGVRTSLESMRPATIDPALETIAVKQGLIKAYHGLHETE